MTQTTEKENIDLTSNVETKADNQLALFEDLKKDITIVAKESVRVPTSYIFGRGSLAHVQSFGGKTLAENAAEVDKALANVGTLENIWNHSHTQWSWKHLNLNYHAPLNNMRQISAEIASKKAALNEAKWRNVDAEVKIRKIEEELEKGGLDYWREVELKIKLAKLREGLSEGAVYIEGAMKDVLALNSMFEDLKKKTNGFTEADIEREETKSHLRRSIVQSIRDVRQSGVISKGEQEYIENIGVNPSKLQDLIRNFVQAERESESWDVTPLFEFVESITNELVDICKVDKKLMEIQGFSQEFVEEFTFNHQFGILEHKTEEIEKREENPGE